MFLVRVQSWVRVDFIRCRTWAFRLWILFVTWEKIVARGCQNTVIQLRQKRDHLYEASLFHLYFKCLFLVCLTMPRMRYDYDREILQQIGRECLPLSLQCSRWTSGWWKHHHRIYITDNVCSRHLSTVTTVSCWYETADSYLQFHSFVFERSFEEDIGKDGIMFFSIREKTFEVEELDLLEC